MGSQAKGKKLSGAQVGSYNVLKIMSLTGSVAIFRGPVLYLCLGLPNFDKLSFLSIART